jgi:hypothetical protein
MSDDTVLREKQRRLHELKEQQARSGIDTRPQIEAEIEDLQAEIAMLEGTISRAILRRLAPTPQRRWRSPIAVNTAWRRPTFMPPWRGWRSKPALDEGERLLAELEQGAQKRL